MNKNFFIKFYLKRHKILILCNIIAIREKFEKIILLEKETITFYFS